MLMPSGWAAFLLMCLLPWGSLAQGLPRAKSPEEVGFSSERLKRLSVMFKSEIEKGITPGAVLLVARRGKVAYFEALGAREDRKSTRLNSSHT